MMSYQEVLDVVAAFVDDFIARFDADAELAPFLGGINAAAGGRIRQHIVDFICAWVGGPCVYNGQDMPSAHEGLGIQSSHYDLVIGHMRAALEAQGVKAKEQQELLTMLKGLKDQIVAN